ncbi:MAG: 30S ribosomal protein S24e [Candidatus Methanocomedens sp.]|nr:MAG: 30S ribosomal protein S24e [ANME-2 cluster archaeon]
MDIEITKERGNPLLDRNEITFNISNTGATPSRDEVKNKLVAMLNSKYELVVLGNLTTEYGAQKTVGYAKIYSDAKRAEEVENDYIIERNKPKPVEEVEEEPAEAAVDETAEKAGDEAPVTEEASEEAK